MNTLLPPGIQQLVVAAHVLSCCTVMCFNHSVAVWVPEIIISRTSGVHQQLDEAARRFRQTECRYVAAFSGMPSRVSASSNFASMTGLVTAAFCYLSCRWPK